MADDDFNNLVSGAFSVAEQQLGTEGAQVLNEVTRTIGELNKAHAELKRARAKFWGVLAASLSLITMTATLYLVGFGAYLLTAWVR